MEKIIEAKKLFYFLKEYAKLKGIKTKKNNHNWIQNMIFFIHWEYLKKYQKNFISEKIEAWNIGPVINELYDLKDKVFNSKETKQLTIEKLKNKFQSFFNLDNDYKMWEHFEETFEKYNIFSDEELSEKAMQLNSFKKAFKEPNDLDDLADMFNNANIISNEDMMKD